jgi:hypothetical protein
MRAEKLANGVRGLVDEGTEPETGSHVTTSVPSHSRGLESSSVQ